MSGLGFSALLIGTLLPRPWQAVEAEMDGRPAMLLRLGVMLAAELALFLALTVGAVGLPALR
jgi:hypothetical protein